MGGIRNISEDYVVKGVVPGLEINTSGCVHVFVHASSL